MGERDAAVIEALYREAGPRLWRSLFLYSGDREIASDAVAETFARALAGGDSIRHPERWIWKVGFRVATVEMKRRSSQARGAVDLPYDLPEEAVELLEALRGLRPKARAAIVLHYLEGLSLEEVAARLGSTRSAVGVNLHRARKRLRELLGDVDG